MSNPPEGAPVADDLMTMGATLRQVLDAARLRRDLAGGVT